MPRKVLSNTMTGPFHREEKRPSHEELWEWSVCSKGCNTWKFLGQVCFDKFKGLEGGGMPDESL